MNSDGLGSLETWVCWWSKFVDSQEIIWNLKKKLLLLENNRLKLVIITREIDFKLSENYVNQARVNALD